MLHAMQYKEFKQRIRRKLGMKKHQIHREHATLLDRNTRRVENIAKKSRPKTDVPSALRQTVDHTNEDVLITRNNHAAKV